MRNEKKRRRKTRLISPMQLTGELQKLGEKYDRKTAGLYYLAVLFVAIGFGFLFELNYFLIAFVGIVYLFFVPQMIYNQKKHAYEMRRFEDVNAYMHQMIQSFVRTRNVALSMNETKKTFTEGKMLVILSDATELIENFKPANEEEEKDPRAAEKRAFALIEEKYGCEKLRMLHDFLIKATERGGACVTEFSLLEKSRELWKDAVMEYYEKIKAQRNYGSLLYMVIMIVCIFLMNFMERMGLRIADESFTQVANALMLVMFNVFFTFMDKRLNANLLRDPRVMSQDTADMYFKYMQGFESKRERKKYIGIAILSVVLAVGLVLYRPEVSSLFLAAAIVAVGFNAHQFILSLTVRALKKEIDKEFPKWLFDMLLLLQRESVEGAMFKSVERVSPVLKGDLQRVCVALATTPQSADVYMSFLADFKNPNISETMRTLYSLSVGTGGEKQKVMGVIIESNIVHLSNAEKKSIEDKGSYSGFLEALPVFVASGALMLYMIALMTVSFVYMTSFY